MLWKKKDDAKSRIRRRTDTQRMRREARIGMGLGAVALAGTLIIAMAAQASHCDVKAASKTYIQISVDQGEDITLRCTFQEFHHVAWLNQSTVLYDMQNKSTPDPRVSLAAFARGEYSIVITDVNLSDEGTYACKKRTLQATSFEYIFLMVRVPPKIVNISSDVTLYCGDNLHLYCQATGKPEPAISWEHLKGGGFFLMDELKFGGMNPHYTGEYECTAYNGASQADTRKVNVMVNCHPMEVVLRKVYSPSGGQVQLRCDAPGYPVPEITWAKAGSRRISGWTISSKNEKRNMASSILAPAEGATLRQPGNYTCTATNQYGSMSSSVDLEPLLYPDRAGGDAVGGGGSHPVWVMTSSFFCVIIFNKVTL